MPFKVAVDTGGTFTDVVLADDAGHFSLSKAPTTPQRIFDGIGNALKLAAEERSLDLRELLAQTQLLIYATTRSTNAILTGQTARTALITTKGFRDVLTLREGGKLRPFDFRQRYPDPYIPRGLTFEVDERITSEGEVLTPLCPDDVSRVIGDLVERGVQAVAVALLWSIANPAHEQLIGELLSEQLPHVPFTLSSELNPIIREYRRTSSAAIDASLKPLMQRHLGEMRADLDAAGFAGELLLVTSFGGVLRLDDIAQQPLYSVNSGPAMAPVAGRTVAAPASNLVVCDTGGTSFDVSVIRDGEVQLTRETWLGEPFTGHITGLSSVAVKNVGAGGGSVGWIDSGGLLRVGPQSAGAEPGPVCYGLGGTEPTVTDAALALGYLDPDYFLGGRIALEREAAERAIERVIAQPLGITLRRGAWAILAIANQHMVTAVREITINQGIDPRDSVLVAGGGAAGLTMAKIAEELGCRRVLIPRTAAALSATGGLFGDVVSEFTSSYRTHTGGFDFDGVNDTLDGLDGQMDQFFGQMQIAADAQVREFVVEARYPYQIWELDVALTNPRFANDSDVASLEQAFHEAHERVFAVSERGQRVDCLMWKARASVRLPKPDPPSLATNGAGPGRSHTTRPTWWGQEDALDAPIHRGELLGAGTAVAAPAIVELPTTTIVVYPDWVLTVSDRGDFVMTRDAGERPNAEEAE